MIRLLQFIFLGHAHKWKIIREVKLVYAADPEAGTGAHEGRRYDLQCERCGDVRKRDLV